MCRKKVFYILLILFSSLTMAGELEINPGLWETTITRTNPMTGKLITETETECVKEKTFDPAKMMKEVEGCKAVKNELSGNTLSFEMECNIEGGQSTISGEYSTDGKTGKGDMNITMNMAGMSMEMKMNWSGERIKDC